MKRLGLGIITLSMILGFSICTASEPNDNNTQKEVTRILKLRENDSFSYHSMGQKIWIKKMSKFCKKDGIKSFYAFSAKNSQESWIKLKNNNKITEEWIKICPSSKSIVVKFNDKYVDNLYQVCVKYANDSGYFPD